MTAKGLRPIAPEALAAITEDWEAIGRDRPARHLDAGDFDPAWRRILRAGGHRVWRGLVAVDAFLFGPADSPAVAALEAAGLCAAAAALILLGLAMLV